MLKIKHLHFYSPTCKKHIMLIIKYLHIIIIIWIEYWRNYWHFINNNRWRLWI